MTWVEKAQGIGAIAAIVFGLALSVVAVLQWLVYRRQATIMAAQARTQIETQRAFVFVKEIAVDFDRDPGRPSAYGEPAPGRVRRMRLAPIWENSGTTPARRVVANFNFGVFPGSMPDQFEYPDGREPERLVLGAKATAHSAYLSIDAPFDRVLVSGQRGYIWGWIDYDDAFEGTERHRTEFCHEVAVADRSSDGQVWLGFPFYGRFNGADGECLRRPMPYK